MTCDRVSSTGNARSLAEGQINVKKYEDWRLLLPRLPMNIGRRSLRFELCLLANEKLETDWIEGDLEQCLPGSCSAGHSCSH